MSCHSLRNRRRPASLRHRPKHPHADVAANMNTPKSGRAGVFIFALQPNWKRCAVNIQIGFAPRMKLRSDANFEFPFGKPQFPAFVPPDGSSSRRFSPRACVRGLRRRYVGKRIVSDTGADVPLAQVKAQVEEELSIIADVGYEEYFLITWDFLQNCRRRGIEWITRGSAADQLVCYCLGIQSVCPIRFDLYFRRFLNKERMALNKLPDIDIDFAHDRKDDVVKTHLREIWPRALRGRGRLLDLPSTKRVRGSRQSARRRGTRSAAIHRTFPVEFRRWLGCRTSRRRAAGRLDRIAAREPGDPRPAADEEPYRTAIEMAEFLDGVPRYPKMHPCGVVLSRQPMHELTPTFIANKGYATTHFDMDAVEAVGLVKMDILAQGGLAAMRDVKAIRPRSKRAGESMPLTSIRVWNRGKIPKCGR